MIQFNTLSINPEGTELIIDVSVKSSMYYESIYIDKIVIDTQDTYTENNPSSNPVYTYTATSNKKSINLKLKDTDILASLNKDLLFVYVVTKGNPALDVPCGEDNKITLGVICNLYPIYQQSVNYLKELTNNCEIPKNFINYILRYKGLQLAIKTGHYTEAIKYWNWFFKESNNAVITNNCGCHG